MGFKASDKKEGEGFQIMPAGEYTLALVKFERKESQTAGNFYANCQFSVTKGEFKKRVVFLILNLENANDTAQEIAEAQLRGLMDATGVGEIKNSWTLKPLLNKEFKATIKIRKDDTWGDKNEIANFIPKEDGAKTSSNDADPFGDDEPEKKKKKKKKKGKKNKKSDVPF